jgi:hypothetical protein
MYLSRSTLIILVILLCAFIFMQRCNRVSTPRPRPGALTTPPIRLAVRPYEP